MSMYYIIDNEVTRAYRENPASVTVHREETPDGPLHTFTWEGGDIALVSHGLLAQSPDFFTLMPWPLMLLWSDELNRESYYRRLPI